jgi:uncharacterized SAM-binding protein YcdF (DUF218 family)
VTKRRLAAVGCVALLVLLLLNPQWYLPAIGGWLRLPSETPERGNYEAVVVLGGGGQQRLLQGIALWKLQPESLLWHTGDLRPEHQRHFVDPAFARSYAIGLGVAPEKITLLQSTSTWEDGVAVKAVVEESGVKQVIIVTNYFHSRRAMCVMRHHLAESGATLAFVAPSSDDFDPAAWWQSEQDLVDVSEEWLKVLLYWQQYGLAPWRC